jgi:glucan phosphoethanolaminetransferase (alkaline phosphatase superfamily)
MLANNSDAKLIFKSPIYPIIVLLSFLPFVAYLQKSRILPRGITLNSPYEYLSYFHSQLGFYILITAVIAFIPKLRNFFLLIFSAFFVIDTMDWLSWYVQKRPFFFEDIYRSIQLLIYYPEFVTQLAGIFKIKLVFLLSLPIVLYIFLRISYINQIILKYKTWFLKAGIFILVMVVLSLPFLISTRYPLQNTFIYMLYEGAYQSKLSNLKVSYEDMKDRLGHTGIQTSISDFNLSKQSVKKPNIIVFVIETAPYSFYPSFKSLLDGINNPWLSKHSIYFKNHYTTYPATDRAIFSIFSGKYPTVDKGNDWKEEMNYGESLLTVIRRHNYRSYFLSTAPFSFYNDQFMYSGLGFDVMIDIEDTKALLTKEDGKNIWDREGLYEMDKLLTNRVINTLDSHHKKHPNTPFLVGIAPQSSHAPFHCPPEFSQTPEGCNNDLDKINVNALWQFNLLKQVIEKLSEESILENTIVIVTGDHGIRSEQESPLLKNQSLLDDATFHVPLLISTPLLQQTGQFMHHTTSHIDLAPTLLRLIGASYNESDFHGRNIFNQDIRTIYFLGGSYSPVSGFVDNTGYYMENRSSFYYLISENLDFSKSSDRYSSSLSTKKRVSTELLQIRSFLQSEYHQ